MSIPINQRLILPEITRPESKAAEPAEVSGGAEPVDFAKALTGAMQSAGESERAADEASKKFAAGDPTVGIHEVMIASEKASIGVRYAVTLKNRVLEAYRDLMNTPL